MGFLIQFIADAAPWVYFLCGLAALYQLYRTWQVRAERRQAIFTLEREKALADLYGIFVRALAILAVMGVTYFISNVLAVAVEPVVEETLEPQPQVAPELLPTPTYTPLPATPTPTITPTPQPQPVQPVVVEPPTPVVVVDTPTPEPPPVAPALCPDARSAIVSPGNGAVVSGQVSFVGTAQHERFSYYKLEFAPGSDAGAGFVYFDGAQNQVVNGLLGVLNTPGLPNGVYTVRLVVVDETGNYPEPCHVNINVQN